MRPNRYLYCLTRDRSPMEWVPGTLPPEEDLWPSFIYFGQVLEEMERTLRVGGLTFYITFDNDELPSYGDDVVVLVIDDEMAIIPRYADRVRAVFKDLGARPRLGCHPVLEPGPINTMTTLVYCRNASKWLPSAARYGRARLGASISGRRAPASLHEVPIGTFNQIDLPTKNLLERRSTLFFAGSVLHASGRRAQLKGKVAPKTMSRSRMLAEAERIVADHPGITLDAGVTGGFRDSIRASGRAYSERLAEAQISLVPRGTTAHTSRFFQSLRYGCIVITDILPSLWHYSGAPAIRLADWSELERTVLGLLEDRERMQALHEQSLRWWEAACSERAVGAQMAAALNARA